jgi:uncharacterized peroxidase-related enzyme
MNIREPSLNVAGAVPEGVSPHPGVGNRLKLEFAASLAPVLDEHYYRCPVRREAFMVFIKTVPVAEAAGEVKRMYEEQGERLGYVPNYAKAFSLRPQVMDGWAHLLKSIRSTMDGRRYELVTLAAARALKSSYCALAHGRVLERQFFSTEDLTRIARRDRSPLEPAEAAILAFAEKVVRQAEAVTQEDVDTLRNHGLDDGEIFEVAAAAAARCFFSKVLDALGAEPDASYGEMAPELRDALTVGRPIGRGAAESI